MRRSLDTIQRVTLTAIVFCVGLLHISQAQRARVSEDGLARAVAEHNRRVVAWAGQGRFEGADEFAATDPLVYSLRERAEALERLVELDPAKALTLQLPEDVAKTLRSRNGLKPFVERLGTWKAPVEVIVEDLFDLGTSRTLVNLRTDGGEVGAYFSDPVPDLECRQQLMVEGMGIGGAIAVTSAVPGEKGSIRMQRASVSNGSP